ncbi:MAG: RNA polymerase sigma factor [Deltaproteobacteria bacterium]|nr:RNA polymerase sigma factor [Deltaproteobacteria bacterium]
MATVEPPVPASVDERRFSQLVIDQRTRLFHYLRRQGATPDVAEDCLQEALVRAFRSLDRLRDWDKARGWLYGIARHVFLDHTRRTAVRARPVEPAPDESPSPDEQLDRADQVRWLKRAVERLGPPRSEVIDLHYGSGLTVEEIARALDLPPGTVKTHLYRARAELRRSLVEES